MIFYLFRILIKFWAVYWSLEWLLKTFMNWWSVYLDARKKKYTWWICFYFNTFSFVSFVTQLDVRFKNLTVVGFKQKERVYFLNLFLILDQFIYFLGQKGKEKSSGGGLLFGVTIWFGSNFLLDLIDWIEAQDTKQLNQIGKPYKFWYEEDVPSSWLFNLGNEVNEGVNIESLHQQHDAWNQESWSGFQSWNFPSTSVFCSCHISPSWQFSSGKMWRGKGERKLSLLDCSDKKFGGEHLEEKLDVLLLIARKERREEWEFSSMASVGNWITVWEKKGNFSDSNYHRWNESSNLTERRSSQAEVYIEVNQELCEGKKEEAATFSGERKRRSDDDEDDVVGGWWGREREMKKGWERNERYR